MKELETVAVYDIKQRGGVALNKLRILPVLAAVAVMTGCASRHREINVISREDGSGTRGAFVSLFGLEEKDENGNAYDLTSPEAGVTNSTAVVMTTVAGDADAIGYISLGSLSPTVKALHIDGAAPSTGNINNGSYQIARPFLLATKGELSAEASDFMGFLLSADGQEQVEKAGYVAVTDNPPYSGGVFEGKIVVAGSSSVAPVMEKLKEAYLLRNPGVTLEVQLSDSTTGMTSVAEGICDIGMASRELKESEAAKGLSSTVLAMDGIVIIVNRDNPLDGLTAGQVADIFSGTITDWNQLEEEASA